MCVSLRARVLAIRKLQIAEMIASCLTLDRVVNDTVHSGALSSVTGTTEQLSVGAMNVPNGPQRQRSMLLACLETKAPVFATTAKTEPS